jgi:hypothetical protein
MSAKINLITGFILAIALPNVCSANEVIKGGKGQVMPTVPDQMIALYKAERDYKSFEQKGFYRIVNPDINEYCYNNRRNGDPNFYKKTPLNYEDLPNIDGNTLTMNLKTSSGDVDVEYQFCIYYDQANSYYADPCTDPNILMNWEIEKVEKVFPLSITDVKDFYYASYYVMQWKIKRPPKCKTIDSFADWLPNNIGTFMTKYAEKNGFVYYVSNPLVFLKPGYEAMAGTYIGKNEIHSYIPSDSNAPNDVHIHYDKFYHPLNDITKDICIEGHCYKYYYYMFSCN